MSEWWSYSPSDFLLFSPQTYYRLFELHNAALWPLHVPAIAFGMIILGLILHGGRGRRGGDAWQGRIIAGILALCWLWVAWSFLFTRYATINWAARYVAALFAVQALLLILFGVIGGTLTFAPRDRWSRRAGLGLFVFALLIQPWIGPLAGRDWRQAELFAIAPDPTVTATLGILLLAPHWSRGPLLTIPVLWCAISGATLWTMAAPDALVLPAAAALAVGGAVWPRISRSSHQG